MAALRPGLAWVWAAFVLAVSFATYVPRFEDPASPYWDENYHIASAQKYLNGVFFMEPHPPLGKLLIAIGEKIVHANAVDDQFIGTDYARDFPPEFSFAGYRLIPVLLAWLTAPLLYACLLLVTGRVAWAGFLSFLYIFDNALIVHLRGAMLESTLLFFSVLTILAFLLARRWQESFFGNLLVGVVFGVSFAGVMLTKVLGLVLVLLVPLLLVSMWPRVRVWLAFVLAAAPAFTVTYVLVWQIHFALGSQIVPSLPNDGFYQASAEYRDILAHGRTGSLAAFPVMLGDALRFPFVYTQGVPRLDLSKPDENGSPFFLWPLGARSIAYRWDTQDGQMYRYLYLQVNPVVWLAGLLAVLVSCALFVHWTLVGPSGDRQARFFIGTFLALYVGYMVAISRLDRVMYLYHYFLPLLFSFFLLAVVAGEVRRLGPWRVNETGRTAGIFVLGALVLVGFRFYHPLTYAEPLTDDGVRARALFPLWELHCARCPRESILVVYKES